MKANFSTDDIFKMAEQLEERGVTFYRLAAQEVSNLPINKLLLDLARWEEGHKKIFAHMRAALKKH